MAVMCIVPIVDSRGLPFDLRIIECAAPAKKYVIAISLRYRLGNGIGSVVRNMDGILSLLSIIAFSPSQRVRAIGSFQHQKSYAIYRWKSFIDLILRNLNM